MNTTFLDLTVGALALLGGVFAFLAWAVWRQMRPVEAPSERQLVVAGESRTPDKPVAIVEAASEPPSPDPEPPKPPEPPPRFEAYLISREAPADIRLPVRLSRTRLVELGLPVRLLWTGADALEGVEIRVTVPNEITYGASLERMAATAAPDGLAEARQGYRFAGASTLLFVSARALESRTPVTVIIPISIKPGMAATYPIDIEVAAGGLAPILRRHRLEVVDLAGAGLYGLSEAWTCTPDERRRIRDPAAPLDRIVIEAD